jgi:hypothetical protein
MRKEYDFSDGERGKFYNPDAVHYLPVYLDTEVFDYLADKAQRRGKPLNDMVNELLRKDIALAEDLK